MWPKLSGLERLASIGARSFKTLPFVAFSVDEWAADSEKILKRIREAKLGPTVVVRSCAGMEDAGNREPPGFFDSILNVRANDSEVRQAVKKVIESYVRRAELCRVTDLVIVQEQLLAPGLCGVCQVGPSESNYIEIDYDETLGRTDAVTSGTKSKRVALSPRSWLLQSPWRQIRECADELRRHFEAPFFVEFALNAAGEPTVFQTRAERRVGVAAEPTGVSLFEELEAAAGVVEACGPLSVMTDWNPAEILGVRPLPLDISLYHELVMQGAWSDGRASVGWARPSDLNLMVVVAGRPYVKIRQSLQSLLPEGLDAGLAKRLVLDRLARLAAEKDLHDKVEFRLMWSAYAFNAAEVEVELRERGFLPSEVQELFDALKRVTRHAIDEGQTLLYADRHGIAQIEAKREVFSAAGPDPGPAATAELIRAAMSICKAYGTVPFSRQARLAFTCRFIINHLVKRGGLERQEVEQWQSGLNTVTRQMSRDLARVQGGELSQQAFLHRYGHLRPSTYDLESLRYDERGSFVGENVEGAHDRVTVPKANARLAEILDEIGSRQSQSEFWSAAARAYRGREEMKFHFTALLSDILHLLAVKAKAAAVERRELRGAPIGALLGMMAAAGSWREFGECVKRLQDSSKPVATGLRLPDIIFHPGDLDVIMEPASRPTFVGSKPVTGEPHVVQKGSLAEPGKLTGAIIAVETADPGFDWLFGHHLGGLITAYGGEFSHMGLRCGEFGIPAALGCGPTVFAAAVKAKELRLDPARGELWADGSGSYRYDCVWTPRCRDSDARDYLARAKRAR